MFPEKTYKLLINKTSVVTREMQTKLIMNYHLTRARIL